MLYPEEYQAAKAVSENQIEFYEKALALIPKILAILPKFDGKMVNKRLDSALKQIDSALSCTKNTYCGHYEIKLYAADRYVLAGGSCRYIRDDVLWLSTSNDRVYHWIDDEGRLSANALIAGLQARQTALAQNVAAMRQQLADIDRIIARHKKLMEEKDRFRAETNPLLMDYFKLAV